MNTVTEITNLVRCHCSRKPSALVCVSFMIGRDRYQQIICKACTPPIPVTVSVYDIPKSSPLFAVELLDVFNGSAGNGFWCVRVGQCGNCDAAFYALLHMKFQ